MSDLIIPVEDQFPGRITYRGTPALQKLKDKFNEHNLLERANKSVFKQFFTAPQFKFSGTLIHGLLMRKIPSNKVHEVQFRIGCERLRFGTMEFAMITGLSFEAPDTKKYEKLTLKSGRLVELYFEGANRILSSKLEEVFKACKDVEDTWKLGLCFLVDSVLYGNEPVAAIEKDLLLVVEDLDFFYNYPWGHKSFEKTLGSYRKDMRKQRAKYLEKVVESTMNSKQCKGQQIHAQYTLYGFAPAIQYWAYEAIREVGLECATFTSKDIPRMVRWKSVKIFTAVDVANMLNKDKVRVLLRSFHFLRLIIFLIEIPVIVVFLCLFHI